MTQFYPLLFKPVLKDYIWGGRNLETKLNRPLPAEGTIAESWEIAAHEDGTTTVINGPHSGRLLTELLTDMQLDLIGTRSAWALERQKFPLLIKLLDANRNLSVQVHPNDEYALEHEGNELGKTEMWVVLHAEAGAEVILGVKADTTPELFRQGILEGALEPYLHRIEVKTGDHICVPAGSLHAIMEGLLIAEIQQNSNTTYRVYDWNRVGADGQPRPLHVDQALDVINFQQVEPALPHPQIIADESVAERAVLCQNQYFTVERIHLTAERPFTGSCTGATFEIWGIIDGAAVIEHEGQSYPLQTVQFVLLPAAMGPFIIRPSADAVFLRAYVDAV